jgi:DNA invertase Pin-like site-specific DNA recombinase
MREDGPRFRDVVDPPRHAPRSFPFTTDSDVHGGDQHHSSGVTRVALYARVSTNDQRLDLQLDELREFCRRRGWLIAGEFIDKGVSGSKRKRPGLERLLEEARRHRFDVVGTWKLDRLARSVSHLLLLKEEFDALGIDFFSLTETLDTATPQGRMIFTILGAVAEFERDLIRERIRAGMHAAKARGKKMGRPCLTPSPEKVEELRQLRRRGLSIRQLARVVKWAPSNGGPARRPSPSLVQRHLKSLEEPEPRAST